MKFSEADNDHSLWGEATMGEGEKPKVRRAVAFLPSKVSICTVLKIKLVAELQMTLTSSCRTPNDIYSNPFPYNPVRFPAKQDCESTIPISFLFIVSFKNKSAEVCYVSEFLCI